MLEHIDRIKEAINHAKNLLSREEYLSVLEEIQEEVDARIDALNEDQ